MVVVGCKLFVETISNLLIVDAVLARSLETKPTALLADVR